MSDVPPLPQDAVDPGKQGATTALRIVFWLIFLVGAGIFAHHRLSEREHVAQENEATELYNRGQIQRALRLYEAMYPDLEGEEKQRVAKQIAKCHVALGGREGMGPERDAHYKKAMEYDESEVPKKDRERLRR